MDRCIALVQNPAQVQPVEMALFMGSDPPYNPAVAAEESAELRAVLEKQGMDVVSIRDGLRAAPREAVRTLAEASVGSPDAERSQAVREALAVWTQPDLVDLVIRQPTPELHEDPELAAISPDSAYESYVLRPLYGLMFPRDHYVDLGGPIALGRIRRRDRARETAVVETVLTHLRGRPAEAAVGAGRFLEGGDVAVSDTLVVLNVGFRSSPQALDDLWPCLAKDDRTVVVVRDIARRQEEFHLDHWFALGPGIAMVAEDRLDNPDVIATCYRPSESDAPVPGPPVTLRRALEEAGVVPLTLDQAAVANFAANTLFLPGRKTALTSRAAHDDVVAPLEAHGFDVVSLPFDEHHKQFGSVHCAVNTLVVPRTIDSLEQT